MLDTTRRTHVCFGQNLNGGLFCSVVSRSVAEPRERSVPASAEDSETLEVGDEVSDRDALGTGTFLVESCSGAATGSECSLVKCTPDNPLGGLGTMLVVDRSLTSTNLVSANFNAFWASQTALLASSRHKANGRATLPICLLYSNCFSAVATSSLAFSTKSSLVLILSTPGTCRDR